MRGWPRTCPQPHIKAGRQLLSHKRLPAFQGPAGGVSRGAVQPTWPPPGRACNHGGGACPLTTRGWEVLVAGHLGEPYGATQASHLAPPPPPPHSWPSPSDRHTPAAVPASPPACPLPLSHWPQITITRWHAALLLSPPFCLDTSPAPTPFCYTMQVTRGINGEGRRLGAASILTSASSSET